MEPLTLFYNVSEKYQKIVGINAAQHIKMCEHPIDLIFVVCAKGVDSNQLLLDIKEKVDRPVEIKTIREEFAADVIGLNHTTDSRIRNDGYMLMIAAKLHADIITGRDNIIITDPDNLILKKTHYIENDKAILYYSDPYTANWNTLAKEIFNIDGTYDFMTEKLLVQSNILKPMREFLGDAISKYSYHRHSWYDISQDEYDQLRGSSWPEKFVTWDQLPLMVQDEIKSMLPEKLLKTEWFEYFADYMVYGYYAMLYHPDKIILKSTKIQNGPWGDGTADIFLNRPSQRNSIDAFRYICNINKIRIE